ncbi:MAG: hypothetical protein HN627_11555 [Opitutae bacterium]|nr:hypothetical protein [Opitutae bacterium]MBT7924885.1 hypothetical protein [Opitutae bacterium]
MIVYTNFTNEKWAHMVSPKAFVTQMAFVRGVFRFYMGRNETLGRGFFPLGDVFC